YNACSLSNETTSPSEFRARLEKGETLESLIPEAFAVVREASKRGEGVEQAEGFQGQHVRHHHHHRHDHQLHQEQEKQRLLAAWRPAPSPPISA
ncbi:hypothetical protein FK513_31630, partial [Klebsiella pneumoniae]|uniref:hypothetical protein n=1 Tax=Klebsiella pneumoniae TaxID=573 RepID=UPI003F7AE897|nr:hypothetical protein [Klebsiella pneumoniae]